MDSWVTEKNRAERKPGVSGEGEMRKRGKKEEDQVRTRKALPFNMTEISKVSA